MNFLLIPKSVTLNGLERRKCVIFRYFSEFRQLPGALRKSSRSLSHLLMSSCPILAALLHGTPTAGFSQTLRRGTRNGITELSQRAPPVFGRAAMMLGIGPHSSFHIEFAGYITTHTSVGTLYKEAFGIYKQLENRCPALRACDRRFVQGLQLVIVCIAAYTSSPVYTVRQKYMTYVNRF